MVAAPVALLFLPADFFDYGSSICPSILLFDKECPGCGMTRATMHMMHFDFKEAWAFNRLSFFLVPILLYFYFSILIKFIRRGRGIEKKKPVK
jgi:hypothetical protein